MCRYATISLCSYLWWCNLSLDEKIITMKAVTICHMCVTLHTIITTVLWNRNIVLYIYSIQPPDERKRCRPRERTCTGERGNVGKQKQHARKTLTWADFMSVIFTSTEPRPLISLFMQSFDLRLKEVITYHRPGPWQRCFFAEPRCFWPHTCSCPCPPAGPFWWRDYGQPWWKNWGRSLGRSHPRFAATPPEKIFQWSKIDCISTETVSPLPRSSTTRCRIRHENSSEVQYFFSNAIKHTTRRTNAAWYVIDTVMQSYYICTELI